MLNEAKLTSNELINSVDEITRQCIIQAMAQLLMTVLSPTYSEKWEQKAELKDFKMCGLSRKGAREKL